VAAGDARREPQLEEERKRTASAEPARGDDADGEPVPLEAAPDALLSRPREAAGAPRHAVPRRRGSPLTPMRHYAAATRVSTQSESGQTWSGYEGHSGTTEAGEQTSPERVPPHSGLSVGFSRRYEIA